MSSRSVLLAGALGGVALVGLGCVSPIPRSLPLELPSSQAHVPTGRPGPALRVGAARAAITPPGSVYLAGFATRRSSTGVRDDIWCRAMVLERGELRIAIVALDLIGLQGEDVDLIRAACEGRGVPASRIVVSATHDHHAPDTLGLWGAPPFTSGRDPRYVAWLGEVVAATVARAVDNLTRAEIASFAAPIDPAGIVKNIRRPGELDRSVTVLHARDPRTKDTIATLVEFGCHPEALHRRGTVISSDYPGHLRDEVESRLGGVALFCAGALGGMATPDTAKAAENDPAVADAECARIGTTLGQFASTLVRAGQPNDRRLDYELRPLLAHFRERIAVPIENGRFRFARVIGVIERPLYEGDTVLSDVDLFRIGDAVFLTAPGEVVPGLGRAIKRRAIRSGLGRIAFLVGLGNDELGYILARDDWDDPVFGYERSMSPGPQAGPLLEETLARLGREAIRAEHAAKISAMAKRDGAAR